jgi:hypothetical protein
VASEKISQLDRRLLFARRLGRHFLVNCLTVGRPSAPMEYLAFQVAGDLFTRWPWTQDYPYPPSSFVNECCRTFFRSTVAGNTASARCLDLRVRRQGESGRERQGGRGGGDTGELFDHLDYFLHLRGYPQKYLPLPDFKGRALLGRKNVVSRDRRESA